MSNDHSVSIDMLVDDENKINSKDNDNDIIDKQDGSDDDNYTEHMIEISPNGKYLVTYINQKIVGVDIVDIKEGKLERDYEEEIAKISHMCVSNEKELAYINYDHQFSKFNYYFFYNN